MSLLRWSVVVVLGLAGSASPSSLASTATPAPLAPPQSVLAVQRANDAPELEARVEIGPAVVYVYDEAGHVVSVE